MESTIRRLTTTFSFKKPIIKVNSIPIDHDEPETTIEENTPLTLVPPSSVLSSSGASSVTAVERDPYDTYTDPIVHNHGWKPETMQAPVLIALAIASLLIAALLEALAQQSASNGGLSIVKTANDIPGLVSFGYLYLPTIVAVLYSLAWNWVDLDVKRMQPWLELSKWEGVTGRDSLFLDYPVDFVAFVPFKAAKRRHWAVFYSGTIVVFVFWVLTPMQGAVFGTSPVLPTHTVNISYPLNLIDPLTQAGLLDQEVLNRAYAITWLNQEFPAFTTPQYTLRPFSPLSLSGRASNWTANTVKYWTELDCWPAQIEPPKKDAPPTANFIDGRGCNASGIIPILANPASAKYKMQYIGYQDSAWADYSLQNPECGRGAWNEFLAAWAAFDNATLETTIRASFCETKYWKQNVTATVTAATLRPVDGSIKPLADPEVLHEAEFNSSAFQYLLGAGFSSVDMPRDFPSTRILDHFSRLPNISIQRPLSPMTPFALGYQNFTIDQYANSTVMAQSFSAVHKMLFSIAFSHLLGNSTTAASSAEGHVFIPQYAIIVSRLFSALVEGFLGLVAIMALLLLSVCRRSESMLTGEPSSLAAHVKLVQNSKELQPLFTKTGHMSDDELKLKLGGYRFQLRCGCLEGSPTPSMHIAGRPDYEEQASKTESFQSEITQPGYLAPVKPFVLRPTAGGVFLLVIVAALVAIIYLKKMDSSLGGLQRPSTNSDVTQFLTNYLPTAFSTLVEPIWVLLNRFYCMLQPFYDLIDAKGDNSTTTKTTTKAMKSKYTALPPQLAFVRAVKSRHFLLAAVCITALLGNVLAVGLGALFNELPKSVSYSKQLAPRYQTSISDNGLAGFVHKVESVVPSLYYDPFYVIMANMSYGTALPPWSTPDFKFLPLDVDGAATEKDATAGVFTGETTGLGVDPGCRSAGVYTSVNAPAAIPMSYPKTTADADGPCPKSYVPYATMLNDTRYSMPQGRAAVEIVDTVTDNYNSTVCDETLIMGWSRADITNRTGTIQTSALTCSPTLRMARFRVQFDAAGTILASTAVSNFTSTWPYQNDTLRGRQRQTVVSVLNYSIRNRAAPWHNDTVSRDWINYLLVLQRNDSRSTLDPLAPLPDTDELLPAVEAIYKLMCVVFLSLIPDTFAAATPDMARVDGTQTIEETRVFVSTPAFIVSTVILGIYIVMALAYYIWGVRLFLPRMPSTVGSLLSYIAPSGIVAARDSDSDSSSSKRVHVDDDDDDDDDARPVRFGRYTGHDGCAQIGIDYADRIVPLDLRRLGHGDTRPRKLEFLRLRKSSHKADTWL